MGTYLKESVKPGITKKTICKLQYEEDINKGIFQIDTLILSLLHRRYMYGFELAKIVRVRKYYRLTSVGEEGFSAWNGNL